MVLISLALAFKRLSHRFCVVLIDIPFSYTNFSKSQMPSDQSLSGIQEYYGSSGINASKNFIATVQVSNTLHSEIFEVVWDAKNRHFILHNSAHLHGEKVDDILNTRYVDSMGWSMSRLPDRNAQGDFLFQLLPVTGLNDTVQRQEQPYGMSWGLTDDLRDFASIAHFVSGRSVLDVGCGKGFATARMQTELKPASLEALEPGSENSFEGAAKYLQSYGVPVSRLTLQQAAELATYQRAFDTVVVFKYNVYYSEKRAFARALASVVAEHGTVLITSVEKDRCYSQKGLDPSLYLIDDLRTCFASVEVKEVSHISHKGQRCEGLIVCCHPIVTTV